MNRFLKSIKHALDGFKIAFYEEANFRIHTLFTIAIPILGFLLKFKAWEWASIFIVIGLVLMAELFNTSIEKTMDWLEPNQHFIVKRVKDLAAAAVFIAALTAVLVGFAIIGPKIISLF